MACGLLRNIHDLKVIEQVNRNNKPLVIPDITRFRIRAQIVSKRLKTVHKTKILIKIFKSERIRKQIIKNCYFYAKWAGSDLQKWDKVFSEYAKSSKKLKILNGLIDEAHSEFLGILSETQKLKDILNKCGKQPFLLREYALLEEDLRIYHAAQKETEREKCSYSASKTDISFKPS